MMNPTSPLHGPTGRALATFACAATCAVGSVSASVQDDAWPEGRAPDAPRRQTTDVLGSAPWPVRLGVRVAALEAASPTISRVVLVADDATYLDEIARWSVQGGRWPVLFEDDVDAPRFIRAFGPTQVVRRASIDDGGTVLAAKRFDTSEGLREAADEAVLRAWDGAPDDERTTHGSIEARWEELAWTPPGVVLCDFADPAWPAAVALAAGRGQPLRTFDEFLRAGAAMPERDPSGVVDQAELRVLADAVREACASTGFAFDELGDDLDTVTLVRSLPLRTMSPLPRGWLVDLSSQGITVQPTEPLATTDVLARGPDGSRFAIVGHVFGSRARAAYIAMCSLFLSPGNALLQSGYARGGDHEPWAVEPAATILTDAGFSARAHSGAQATLRVWRQRVRGGLSTDLLLLNSSGMPDRWSLAENTFGRPGDLPVLVRPVAIHMIHSFSFARGGDPGTIGGRWIELGAHAYVGSVHEPYLAAFIPPELLARRVSSFVPLLVAARQWDGPLGLCWRIATFGDPLMLAGSPKRLQRRRLDVAIDRGVDLRNAAREALVALQESSDDDAVARAMRAVELIGAEEIALRLAGQVPEGERLSNRPETARASLGPLFRAERATDFVRAFRAAGEPEGEAREMLWSIMRARIEALRSASDVAMLLRCARPAVAADDVEAIIAPARRILGDEQLRAAIDALIEDPAVDATQRRRLTELR